MIRLSKLEEQILDTLWDLEKAFPKVILDNMPKPTPPYNTVLSSIRKLEKLGHIGYKKYGKSHEYYPILKRNEYTLSMFRKLYHDLLGGSTEAMLSHFVKGNEDELAKLEAAIQVMKEKENGKTK